MLIASLYLRHFYSDFVFSRFFCDFYVNFHPNGHLFVDSPSIQRQCSTWKVRRDILDFERGIQMEIMTSIQRGNFGVDSTFKIDEISMRFLREFFYVVPVSNHCNCCTCCLHSIIS